MYTSNYKPLDYRPLGYRQLEPYDDRPFLRRNYSPVCRYTGLSNNTSLNNMSLGYTSLDTTSLDLEGCVIENPNDPTKCWIDDNQWKVIKWTGGILLGLYVVSIVIPMVKGIGTTFSKDKNTTKVK